MKRPEGWGNYHYDQDKIPIKIYKPTIIIIRDYFDWSQKQLGEAIGLSSSPINELENWYHYQKPTEFIYNKFVIWFKSLPQYVQDELVECVSFIEIIELEDLLVQGRPRWFCEIRQIKPRIFKRFDTSIH